MRVLDLFSGIGGFSLGLEAAGMTTVAFCEYEDFPRKVLKKHWPDVPCYPDVMELTKDRLDADGITGIDVITGGFPCQDISVAGRGAGVDGGQSGLWREILRLVVELRPRFVIMENSASICVRGGATLVSALADVRYDVEWEGIPAISVGARHIRGGQWFVACPSEERHRAPKNKVFTGRDRPINGGRRPPEPDVGRVANGVPRRVDRLGALGNAVDPKIPELIGRAILQAENAA